MLPYASLSFHMLPYAFICFLYALIAVNAKVSPQEQQQARWSLVYRLLPAEAGKNLVGVKNILKSVRRLASYRIRALTLIGRLCNKSMCATLGSRGQHQL